MGRNETYPIEKALERLFEEIRKLVKKGGDFFFVIPKNKMDKYIYLIETLAWLFLTVSLIFRLGK